MSPQDFQTLADLVRIGSLKIAFEELRRRHGGNFRRTHFEMAYTLLGIARHHVKAPPDDIEKIVRLKGRIAEAVGVRHTTMGERSKRQLDQFIYEPENVALLILLPERLIKGIQNDTLNRKSALMAMHAAAIVTLVACPVRIANLCGLVIGQQISLIDVKGTKKYRLHIPAKEVKNDVTIEAVLGTGASRILDTYINKYRKVLAPSPTQVLFPSQAGLIRHSADFGTSISKTIRDATGLYVTPHGFRHFAAFLYLTEHPGEYATVQKILGHKKLDTTIKFYAPLTTASALERYGDLLDQHWRRR